ncbi:hypothetical protein OJF2_31490 [Aquisphaera giovannonii]|uniref:Uncharacterized protein n=1 Tax=Aquisphaera giovannonii TaxID=406548 RepID=A0A5B9W240_9BACT|nr:hypothetical protein [Aquisphaera giovannonii]QEH34608.1 hypothetical protein OJF2_31490 [Aquisphaera giovannonii]
MGRRSPRARRPGLEPVERRDLLSLPTVMMAAHYNGMVNSPRVRAMLADAGTTAASRASSTSTASNASPAMAASSGAGGRGRFAPSSTSIAVPENQGYQLNPGYNLVLQPTGTATPAEVKRQIFKAAFRGTYVITPGSYSSQQSQVFIRGAGTSTSMLHTDIQMRIAVAADPTLQTTGAAGIFDRNLNSNTVLGLNLAGPRTSVDSRGRPNQFTTVTLDVNASAGTYDEGFSQGVVDVTYYPSRKRGPGIIEQGTAVVRIQAQIYSALVGFILRNASINP